MSESSGLPPEQEAVRRLLADARHDGPPPPDVVARLDETLASLTAERVSERTAAPATEHDDRSPGRVVDLGSRRRRVASIGLLAAASVVVAGVAIGQALPRGGNDVQRVECRLAVRLLARRVPRGRGLQRRLEHQLRRRPGRGLRCRLRARAGVAEELSRHPLRRACRACRRRDADLDDQLLALRAEGATRRQQLATLDALRGCDVPRPGRAAALVAAEVDGRTGVVVFRRPVGEAQGVELYVCGEAVPVRTITLPAP